VEFNERGFLSPGEIQLALPIAVIDHRQQIRRTISATPMTCMAAFSLTLF
jgi:hypothetical protein